MAVFDKKEEQTQTEPPMRVITEDMINRECACIEKQLATLNKINGSTNRTDESVMLSGHLGQLQKMLKIDLNQEYALIEYWRSKIQ